MGLFISGLRGLGADSKAAFMPAGAARSDGWLTPHVSASALEFRPPN